MKTAAHIPLGKVLRLPLRLIPKKTQVRVLSGPSRGAKWIAGSGLHSYWIGGFEPYAAARFAAACQPGDTVLDIGANVGFYTLIAARRVGPAGRVIAFEPWPRNVGWLRTHVAINKLKNTTVHEKAVAEAPGLAHIDTASTHNIAQLGTQGVEVVVTSVDTLGVAPNVIKIDAEGAEARILHGAERTLAVTRPVLFLAVHSLALEEECFAILDRHGYERETLIRVATRYVHYDGLFICRPKVL